MNANEQLNQLVEQFSKKKQLAMHKNSKLRNFMLQMDGLITFLHFPTHFENFGFNEPLKHRSNKISRSLQGLLKRGSFV